MDLAPQYSSVLTGIVRSGVLGASISTAIAGTLRQKVGFHFPQFFKIRFYISKIIRLKKNMTFVDMNIYNVALFRIYSHGRGSF